jgi:hypothetical protein
MVIACCKIQQNGTEVGLAKHRTLFEKGGEYLHICKQKVT